ncbi:MAG: FAD binding domain-containing protein, partial [Anaerolineae bacterium]|nr:FAD binding domain-containing protein [Anaerolineae bacterium]
MRPSNFDYHRAGSVAEAVQMLANQDGAKALAGGHSLLPAM